MPTSSLANKHILITRAASQSATTAKLISAQHAIPILFPCLQHQALKQNIQDGLRLSKDFNDILFSSVTGVEYVLKNSSDELLQTLQNKRIAVIGNKTANALKAYALTAQIIPKQASQQGLIEAYQSHQLPDSLLFFRAEEGSDLLTNYLQQQGIHTQLIKAYRSICPNDDNTAIITMLKHERIDAVLLGSSRTAMHYLQRIGNIELANRPLLVAMSAQVASAADKLGLKVQLIATDASFSSMLKCLADYFSQRSI